MMEEAASHERRAESNEPTLWDRIFTPTVKAVIQGQWISILIAGTGIFATILSDGDANFPLLMNLFNYALLSLFLIRKAYRQYRQRQEMEIVLSLDSFNDDFFRIDEDFSNYQQETKEEEAKPIKISKWIYLIAAFLDVEANFLVLLAYNYTNITSIMLLDCFTIPCVMILSYAFLGYRYQYKHFFGVVICLIGLTCIIVNDIVHGNTGSSSAALLGDILCLSGSIFYACSNVMEETLIKYGEKDEFLGYLGSFGILIAFIQCMIYDLEGMKRAHFTWVVIGSIAGFVLCLFFMYVNTTTLLKDNDAIWFNLSLLTSDVYAVIFAYFFQGYLVDWLYFVAFIFVICGLFLYHSEKQPIQIGREKGTAASVHPGFLSHFIIQPKEEDQQGSLRKNHRFEYNPIIQDSHSTHGSEPEEPNNTS